MILHFKSNIQCQTSIAGRAGRAFAQAGKEFALALFFLTLVLIALAVADRLGAGFPLVHLHGQVVMDFWEHQDDRVSRAQAILERTLPNRSTYNVEESREGLEPAFKQRLTINVKYRNLTGLYDWTNLPWILFDEVDGNRGSSKFTITSVTVPLQLFSVVAAHLLIIPWLIIRLWSMPVTAVPAKPLIHPVIESKENLAGYAGIGLLIGIAISLVFLAMESLKILEFSSKMPSLESLGITSRNLWIAALLLGVAGAVEEAFFRGILLRRFVQNGLPTLGVVACGFWFTAVHAPYFSLNSGNIAYILTIAAAGFALGALTIRMQTWVPAAVVHASYNFTVTWMAGWSLL
ncbi:MAG: type II CAAX endopeptidase family protein [Wenzhouxiangella sp.]|nr:type II CAAX endopeptidase family protein [Wenzhouxiangella sp.]